MQILDIPDYPQVKINNYIFNLSHKISVSPQTNLIGKYLSDSKLDIIALRMGFLKTTLKKYSKRKRYPLSFLKEVNKISGRKIFNLLEKSNPLFFVRQKFVKLPQYITPKLAYFIGYLQGDGSIESNKRRINFTDEYLEQINRINNLCNDLFGVKGRIEVKRAVFSKKDAYRLEVNSLVLNSYLHKNFKIKRGKKNYLNVPTLFLSDKEILKWYLIGLFDADGTLPHNPKTCKQQFVDITFKDKNFILQIKNILDSFGIKTLKPYCRKAKSPNSDYISITWELRIRKKVDMIRFLKIIGFYHPDKKKRTDKLLSHLGQ